MNNLSGKILGNRYILLEKIGEGGMALVYKARCQLLNRYVAIKILRPEFTTDDEFVKKFKRESMAAASISHPNIVGIYDVGEQEGIYYIVMEYIHGHTLKDYIRQKGKLDYTEVLKITAQIGLALEHAHKNGVIHRDIKPHNILITDDKIVKVTDFGIARASSSITMTNTGKVMGSVHYFSPEQARGGYSDHRTDIYSLGVVMYEMLTGKLPYDAESPITVALKHIQDSIIEPLAVNPDVPRAINDIVVKSMEKDMTQRYQNVRELLNDLNIAASDPDTVIFTPVEDKESTKIIPVEEIDEALERDKKSKKKHRAFRIILGILSFAIVAALLVYEFNNYFVVREVVIPKITGLSQEDARKALQAKNLNMQVSGTASDNSPEGTVIRVYPEEGYTVKENYDVSVILSSGPQKVQVPDLSNLDPNSATALLKRNNLVLGFTDTQNSGEIQKGLIISQTPNTGAQVTAGSSVNIVISAGPEVQLVTVPVLTGMSVDDAVNELLKDGLQIGNIGTGSDPKYVDGVIIAQDQQGGTQVKENTAINVTVNKLDNTQETPNTQDTQNTQGN